MNHVELVACLAGHGSAFGALRALPPAVVPGLGRGVLRPPGEGGRSSWPL